MPRALSAWTVKPVGAVKTMLDAGPMSMVKLAARVPPPAGGVSETEGGVALGCRRSRGDGVVAAGCVRCW